MKVERNADAGILTLKPSKEREVILLREIMATVPEKGRLPYAGRNGADPRDPLNERMTVSFRLNGKVFELIATADEDEKPVRLLRDAIFFGAGELIFLSGAEIDGKPVLEFTVIFCKHCGKPMISMGEVEWKTCKICADKCKHNYVRGVVHGGRAGFLAMGEYCDKCGRGKPVSEDEPKKSQAERELEVEKELGITVIYKNLPGVSPAEIVAAEKFAKTMSSEKN